MAHWLGKQTVREFGWQDIYNCDQSSTTMTIKKKEGLDQSRNWMAMLSRSQPPQWGLWRGCASVNSCRLCLHTIASPTHLGRAQHSASWVSATEAGSEELTEILDYEMLLYIFDSKVVEWHITRSSDFIHTYIYIYTHIYKIQLSAIKALVS